MDRTKDANFSIFPILAKLCLGHSSCSYRPTKYLLRTQGKKLDGFPVYVCYLYKTSSQSTKQANKSCCQKMEAAEQKIIYIFYQTHNASWTYKNTGCCAVIGCNNFLKILLLLFLVINVHKHYLKSHSTNCNYANLVKSGGHSVIYSGAIYRLSIRAGNGHTSPTNPFLSDSIICS